MNTEKSSCVGCGSADGRTLMFAPDFDGKRQRYALYECSRCGLVRTHPQPTPQLLQEAYRTDYYGHDSSKFVPIVERWTRYAARKRAKVMVAAHGHGKKRLRILDIGCGRGVLLEAFRSLGHDVVGVERKGSPFEGLPNLACGDLAELNLPPGSFDIIVLWHVLEHLDKPKAVLQHATRLLDARGSLFISVPNFGSRQARLFRSAWFHLDLPRHLFHFSERSLGAMLADTGFAIREKHTFSPDQNLFGFLQSALNAVPGLPDNHLYKILRTRPSLRSLGWLLAYVPLIGILSVATVLELVLSGVQDRGATLTIKAEKIAHDQ